MEGSSQSSQLQGSSSVQREGDEEQRSEATINFLIPTLSKMEGTMLSKPVFIHNLPWRILVMVQDGQVGSPGMSRNKAIGTFVQCTPDSSVPRTWSVSARASLTLVNHLDPSKNHTKIFQHCFSAQSTDWGYSTYIKWKHLVDPARGYIAHDTIQLQAHVIAEEPQGVKPQPSTSDTSDCEGLSGLSCPVCFEEYLSTGSIRPMSLKCGHTFCHGCLQQHCSTSDNQTQLTCFVCKQEHVAFGDSKPWFPNFSIMNLIGHVIPKSKHFCETHHHEKCYYCLDDKQLVCIYCAYHGEHAGHNCEHMEKARAAVERTLWKVKVKASGRVAELERSLQVLKDEQDVLKSQEKNVSQQIEDLYTQITSSLRKQKDSLLEELRTHTGEVGRALDGHIRDLEDKKSMANGVIEEYDAWQGLSTRDALAKSIGLESQLKHLSSHKPHETLNATTTKVSFASLHSDILTSVGLLGRISVALPELHEQEKGGEVAGGAETGPSSQTTAGESKCGELVPVLRKTLEGNAPPTKRRKED